MTVVNELLSEENMNKLGHLPTKDSIIDVLLQYY